MLFNCSHSAFLPQQVAKVRSGLGASADAAKSLEVVASLRMDCIVSVRT